MHHRPKSHDTIELENDLGCVYLEWKGMWGEWNEYKKKKKECTSGAMRTETSLLLSFDIHVLLHILVIKKKCIIYILIMCR